MSRTDAQAPAVPESPFKKGDVIDLKKMDPKDPLRAILERTADVMPAPIEYANLDKAPKSPLTGTYNEGKVKFEKVQIVCTDTGFRIRLTSAKDGNKNFVSFPMTKEPAVGVNLGDATQVSPAALSIDGVTWTLQNSWAIDFKTYKRADFKGKEAVLGHASGRLIWVPFDGSGIKITKIAGTFADAPILAQADCKP